jgi:hypothetical protein
VAGYPVAERPTAFRAVDAGPFAKREVGQLPAFRNFCFDWRLMFQPGPNAGKVGMRVGVGVRIMKAPKWLRRGSGKKSSASKFDDLKKVRQRTDQRMKQQTVQKKQRDEAEKNDRDGQ